MAKGSRGRYRVASRQYRLAPYPLARCKRDTCEDMCHKKCSKVLDKKRSCMQDNCSFVGNYKELKKHVRAEHPSARPRTVDPDHEQKWRWLEWEREREDVISTVTSAIPGAVVFGDYVIEGRHNNDFDTDDEEGAHEAGNAERNGRFEMGMEAMNFFLLLHAVRQGNDLSSFSRRMRPEMDPDMLADQNEDQNEDAEMGVIMDVSDGDNDDDDDDGSYNEGNDDGVSLVSRLRRQGGGRVLLNRSSRRRRRRETHATMGGSG